MGNPYVSSIKLSKELEEKAKALTLKKQQCEVLSNEIATKLKFMKDTDIDISKINKDYAAAKALYAQKKYIDAAKIYEKVLVTLKDYEKKLLSGTEKKFKDFQNLAAYFNIDIKLLVQEYNQAVERKSENFEEVYKSIQSVLHKLDTAVFSKLRNELNMLKKYESVIEPAKQKKIQTRINEIKELIKEKKLELVINKFKALKFEVKESLRLYHRTLLIEYYSLEKAAEYAQIDVTELQRKKALADQKIKDEKFEEAISIMQQNVQALRSLIDSFFKDISGLAKISINEAKKLGIKDTTTFEDRLKKLEDSVNTEQYRKILEDTKTLIVQLEKAKFQKVFEEISSTLKQLAELKESGIEVTESLGYVDNAKDYLKEKRYLLALEEIHTARDKVGQILSKKEKIVEDLNELKQTLTVLNMVETEQQNLDDIADVLSKDLNKAEELVSKLKVRIGNMVVDKANALKKKFDEMITIAKFYNIDTTRWNIEHYNQLLKKEEYIKYLNNMQKVYDTLKTDIETAVKNSIEYIKTDQNLWSGVQKAVTDKIQQIPTLLAEENYKDIITVMEQINQTISTYKKDQYKAQLTAIEASIDQLTDTIKETVWLKEQVQLLKAELENKYDENEVTKIIQNLNTTIHELKQQNIQVIVEALQAIQKFAVSVGVTENKVPVTAMISAVREKLESGEIDATFASAINSKRQAFEWINTIKELYTLFAKIKIKTTYTVAELDKNLTTLLHTAQNAFKKLDPVESKKSLTTVLQKVTELVDTQRIASIKKEIETLEKLGKYIDITAEADKITQFNKLVSAGEYESARMLGIDLITRVKPKIKTYFSEYFSKIATIMGKVRVTYPYIVTNDEKLKAAIRYFVSEEYIRALDTLRVFETALNRNIELYKALNEALSYLKSKLKFAEELNIEMKEAIKLYERSESFIEAGRYTEALSAVRLGISRAGSELNSYITQLLTNARTKLKSFRANETKAIIIEGLITSAESMLKYGQTFEALKKAIEVLGEIEEKNAQKSLVLNIYKKLITKFKEYRPLLPPSLLNKQKTVQSLCKKEAYIECLDQIINVLNQVDSMISIVSELQQYIKTTRKLVKVLSLFGGDTKLTMQYFNNAKQHFVNLEYDKSLIEIKNAVSNLTSNIYIKQIENERIFRTMLTIAHAVNIYSDISKWMTELQQYNDEDYEKILPIRKKIIKTVKVQAPIVIRQQLKTLEQYFNTSTKTGMDVSGLNTRLKAFTTNYSIDLIPHIYQNIKILEEEYNLRLVDFVDTYIARKIDEILQYLSYGVKLYQLLPALAPVLASLKATGPDKILGKIQTLSLEFEQYLEHEITEKMGSEYYELEYIQTAQARKLYKMINDLKKTKQYLKLLEKLAVAKALLSVHQQNIIWAKRRLESIKMQIKGLLKHNVKLNHFIIKLNNIATKIVRDPKQSIPELDALQGELNTWINTLEPKFAIKFHANKRENTTVYGTFEITNIGEYDVEHVTIELKGVLSYFTPIVIDKLRRDEHIQQVIQTVYDDHASSTTQILKIYTTKLNGEQFEKELQFSVTLEADTGFEVKKASGSERCAVCRGRIFKGQEMAVCKTGDAKYHVQCAKRKGYCVVCNRKFNFTHEIQPHFTIKL